MPAYGKGKLEAYWNTEKVIPGSYNLKIILNYAGQTTEDVFDILVDYNKITAALAGRVVGAIEEEPKEGMELKKTVYILITIVVLLVIFNTYIYFKKIRKPPQKQA